MMLRVISDAVAHQYRTTDGKVFDSLGAAERHHAAQIITTICLDEKAPSKQQRDFAESVAQQAAKLMPILTHLVEADYDDIKRPDTSNGNAGTAQ